VVSDSKSLVIIPKSIDECMALAIELSKATTIAAEFREKPANVLAAMMAGQEMGFPPMASLRSLHIIKGVPKLSADAMVAAVLASGKAEYFEPSAVSTTSVTYVTKRVGSSREQSCTWTQEDAKRAGLTSDNHRLYPRQMLASRAKSELARMIYPDILAGVYSEEEIPTGISASIEPAPHYDVPDAEIISETPSDAAALETAQTAIAAAASVEQLKTEVANTITDLKLTGAAKDQATAAYKARMAELRKSNGVRT
jgi:hypothetical protein